MPRHKTIWEQLAAQKDHYIGGTLIDLDDDPMVETPEGGARTTITDITFKPNGDSFMFTVDGEDFGCACDIRYLSVDPGATPQIEGALSLVGYGGHRWEFSAKERP